MTAEQPKVLDGNRLLKMSLATRFIDWVIVRHVEQRTRRVVLDLHILLVSRGAD
jgi:hypothetical protein